MATKNAKSVSVTMRKEKETKNAVRYQEVDKDGIAVEVRDAMIGASYAKKTALPDPYPEEITVTMAWK